MTTVGESAARTADVKRALLVRLLREWAPTALSRARRVTYAHGYADLDDGQAAEAALRVFATQPDLVRGRELAMVAVADDPVAPARRLAAVQQQPGASAALVVHTVGGGTEARWAVALRAVGAARTPLFGVLDASAAPLPPALATVAALAVGKPAELMLVLAPSVLPTLTTASPGAAAAYGDRFFGGDHWRSAPATPATLLDDYRAALHGVGFPLVSVVELAIGGAPGGELLIFATTSGRSLETFKEALWATDGGCLRDPARPDHPAVSTAVPPDPGLLREALLARVRATGRQTVTDLRTFTLTETVYRASDAGHLLSELVAAGTLARTPAHGRLGGDVVLTLAEPAD